MNFVLHLETDSNIVLPEIDSSIVPEVVTTAAIGELKKKRQSIAKFDLFWRFGRVRNGSRKQNVSVGLFFRFGRL